VAVVDDMRSGNSSSSARARARPDAVWHVLICAKLPDRANATLSPHILGTSPSLLGGSASIPRWLADERRDEMDSTGFLGAR
jgi:hypothetical protein